LTRDGYSVTNHPKRGHPGPPMLRETR
jgi:hypothetical protein